ncbi:unnamed protein product, partial [Prorocentrum cordatum]
MFDGPAAGSRPSRAKESVEQTPPGKNRTVGYPGPASDVPDKEVTISYVPPMVLRSPRIQTRRAFLRALRGFACRCRRCLGARAGAGAGLEGRQRLRRRCWRGSWG